MYAAITAILFILTATFFGTGFIYWGYITGISLLIYAIIGAISWDEWHRILKGD